MNEIQNNALVSLSAFINRVSLDMLLGKALSKEDTELLIELDGVFRQHQFREIIRNHFSTKPL